MIKPVCVKCQRFFRIKKNGRYALEMMPTHNEAPPGTAEPGMWKPYKLWRADEWECRGCGATIMVGFAPQPGVEHYEEQFDIKMRTANASGHYGPPVIINDC